MHPVARDTLLSAVDAGWADPRRIHREGQRARRLLDQAREVLGDGLGVRPGELSFHLIGAEALLVGLVGLRHPRRRGGEALVASAVELEVLLLESDGPTVPVDALGRVDAAQFAQRLGTPGVAVAALQHANGEVGTTQPVEAVHAAAASAGVPLLVDATASLGRVATPTAFDALGGDAASFGGPPLGLLAVRTAVRFGLPGPPREAELGRALSAPWVPLALAAAEAWQQVAAVREVEQDRSRALVERIRLAAASVQGVEAVGDPQDRLPHVVTLTVHGVDGEMVADELDGRGFAVASGSACSASPLHPSHVLQSMGVPEPGRPRPGNIRVTLPLEAVAPAREAGVDRFCRELADAVSSVRARIAPVLR